MLGAIPKRSMGLCIQNNELTAQYKSGNNNKIEVVQVEEGYLSSPENLSSPNNKILDNDSVSIASQSVSLLANKSSSTYSPGSLSQYSGIDGSMMELQGDLENQDESPFINNYPGGSADAPVFFLGDIDTELSNDIIIDNEAVDDSLDSVTDSNLSELLGVPDELQKTSLCETEPGLVTFIPDTNLLDKYLHNMTDNNQNIQSAAVTANSGNTVESRKRPLSDSSDTSLAPKKQAKKRSSTISENSTIQSYFDSNDHHKKTQEKFAASAANEMQISTKPTAGVEIKPKAKKIKPKAKKIKPKAKEVKPKAKEVKPKAKEVKPKANKIKIGDKIYNDHEIANMDIKTFHNMRAKVGDEEVYKSAREIRRRYKNKDYAVSSRKRKQDKKESVENEIKSLRSRKEELQLKKEKMSKESKDLKEKINNLEKEYGVKLDTNSEGEVVVSVLNSTL